MIGFVAVDDYVRRAGLGGSEGNGVGGADGEGGAEGNHEVAGGGSGKGAGEVGFTQIRLGAATLQLSIAYETADGWEAQILNQRGFSPLGGRVASRGALSD